mmetsp:Transcript_28689/g.75364  ORF Transcript_28689/g.75364 Transcript_28689/m.75364 type:complete len:241 (-) Transcript_28689:527-1249(-)
MLSSAVVLSCRAATPARRDVLTAAMDALSPPSVASTSARIAEASATRVALWSSMAWSRVDTSRSIRPVNDKTAAERLSAAAVNPVAKFCEVSLRSSALSAVAALSAVSMYTRCVDKFVVSVDTCAFVVERRAEMLASTAELSVPTDESVCWVSVTMAADSAAESTPSAAIARALSLTTLSPCVEWLVADSCRSTFNMATALMMELFSWVSATRRAASVALSAATIVLTVPKVLRVSFRNA